MGNKSIIQLILIIFISTLTYIVYIKIYKKDYQSLEEIKHLKSKIKIEENVQSNLIKDILYKTKNSKGDTYTLRADYGEISLTNDNLVFMTNVKGRVNILNDDDIFIFSKFAKFNKKTFETSFYENVKINRSDEEITGDELYIVFNAEDNNYETMLDVKDENLIRMSGNVIFNKPGYLLQADILEIDMITKDSKIFMIKKNNKVLINTNLK